MDLQAKVPTKVDFQMGRSVHPNGRRWDQRSIVRPHSQRTARRKDFWLSGS